MDNAPPLLLVDGHNLLWRATFGFPSEIRSRDKTRVLTGLFGFFALLRVAIREELDTAPEVVVVFDGEHGAADRRAADPGYKAQRPTDDEAREPIRFLPDVKRGLDAQGIPWVELPHAEADDVIATLTARTVHRQVLIMSGDRDFYQLVDNRRVRILNTAAKRGRRHIDAAAIHHRHRVWPAQWPDFRAMVGDPADNIPGIRGIGDRTAASLLAGGLTLDQLPGSGRLDTGRGRVVADGLDLARKYRDMIRLRRDMTVPHHPTGTATPALPAPRQVVETLDLW